MRLNLRIAIAVPAVLMMLIGCIEDTRTFSLNPNGSGKVEIDSTMPMMAMGNQDGDPVEQVKAKVKQIIENSKGIEAWSHVAYRLTEDGKMHFRGVAYFPDVTQIHFSDGQNPNVTWRKTSDGGMELVQSMSPKTPADAPEPEALSDDEVKERVQQQKQRWAQMKPMLTGMLATAKMRLHYRLPGRLVESTNFAVEEDGVSVTMDGPKIIDTMDKLLKDEKMMAEAIRAGRDPSQGPSDDVLAEIMFGEKGGFRAKVTGDLKPVFDYAVESEAAKKGMPEMKKALGID